MKKLISRSLSVIAAGTLLVFPLQVQASTIEQRQSLTNEFTAECTINGSGSCSGTIEQHASQHQFMTDEDNGGDRDRGNRGWSSNRPANWNDRGTVRLSWDWRGGTCYVQYTESTAKSYKYNTSAACDEGGVTVGGLVPGKLYRFRMKQDNGAWSRPKTYRAR